MKTAFPEDEPHRKYLLIAPGMWQRIKYAVSWCIHNARIKLKGDLK